MPLQEDVTERDHGGHQLGPCSTYRCCVPHARHGSFIFFPSDLFLTLLRVSPESMTMYSARSRQLRLLSGCAGSTLKRCRGQGNITEVDAQRGRIGRGWLSRKPSEFQNLMVILTASKKPVVLDALPTPIVVSDIPASKSGVLRRVPKRPVRAFKE